MSDSGHLLEDTVGLVTRGRLQVDLHVDLQRACPEARFVIEMV